MSASGKKTKSETPELEPRAPLRAPLLVVAAMIVRKGNVLVAQRPGSAKFGAGMWEFPGGKVDFGESPEASLVREIQEEMNAEVQIRELLGATSHMDLPHGLHIVLLSYICELTDSEEDPATEDKEKMEAADVRWLPLNQLDQLIAGEAVEGLHLADFAPGDREPIRRLALHSLA